MGDTGESHHGVMAKVLNYGLEQSKFDLQSCYYIHFQANALGKGMNPLIPLIVDKII